MTGSRVPVNALPREEFVKRFCAEPIDQQILALLESVEGKQQSAREVLLKLMYMVEHGDVALAGLSADEIAGELAPTQA